MNLFLLKKQIMYLCYQYGTESFKKYLFKYRFQQVCNKLKEFFRKW